MSLHRAAKQALYMLWQIRPSVRLSVTLRYCVKTRECRGMRSPLTSPKWGSDTKMCGFFATFDQRPLKVCYKVSLSNNSQRQSCSWKYCLSNGINILAEVDPVPIKFWRRKDERFAFHTRRAVQSAIADLVLSYSQKWATTRIQD